MVQPMPSAADLALLDPDGLFRDRLVADRAELERHREDFTRVRVLVHRLAGAAGTFGYDELGAVAMTLDDQLAAGRSLSRSELEALLSALDRATAGSA